MSTYAPTVEQAARVGTLLARLDDPRELARIAGIGAKEGGLNKADLPSREYIRSRCISIAPKVRNVAWEKDARCHPNQYARCLTDENIESIVRLAASGVCAAEIARAVGFSRDTVVKYMDRKGVIYARLTRQQASQLGSDASRRARERKAA